MGQLNEFFLPRNKNFSFFEITTALSYQYFEKNNVDVAIIECGLGGRLDSTNIIDCSGALENWASFGEVLNSGF